MSDPDSKKPPSQRGRIIIAAIVAAIFGYSFITVANGSEPAPEHTGISRGEAWNLCKQEVRSKLTHPDSADFAILSTDISRSPRGYSIVGTLKATNDFGAEQEISYTCAVAEDGTVEATVSE